MMITGCDSWDALTNILSLRFDHRLVRWMLLFSQFGLVRKRPLKGVNQATLMAHNKEPTCNAGDPGSPWVGKIRWRRKCQSTPVFLPGESHGQRSLAGYNWWGFKESDITEQLTVSLFKLWLNQKFNPDFLAPNAMVSVWFFHGVVLS